HVQGHPRHRGAGSRARHRAHRHPGGARRGGGERDGQRTGGARGERAGHRRRRGSRHRHGEGRGARRPLPDDEGQARRSAPRRRHPHQGMKPPFSLLVVYGDGSRVLRVSLPRWIVYGTLGSFAALAVASLSGGYVLHLGQGDQMAALRRRVHDQRALIDSFHTRVAAVRGEITAWRALHAKMWDALGPEAGAGAGGAAPEAVAPAAGVEPPPREELDLLATSVAQEGPRLRELTRAISR